LQLTARRDKLTLRVAPGNWLKATLQTIGDVSRQVQGEALAALIYFAISEMAQGRNARSIVNQLVSHLRP
jgi:hypothetical protein